MGCEGHIALRKVEAGHWLLDDVEPYLLVTGPVACIYLYRLEFVPGRYNLTTHNSELDSLISNRAEWGALEHRAFVNQAVAVVLLDVDEVHQIVDKWPDYEDGPWGISRDAFWAASARITPGIWVVEHYHDNIGGYGEYYGWSPGGPWAALKQRHPDRADLIDAELKLGEKIEWEIWT